MASAIAALANELVEANKELMHWRCNDHGKDMEIRRVNKFNKGLREANGVLRRKLDDKLSQEDVDKDRTFKINYLQKENKRLRKAIGEQCDEASKQWAQAQEQYKQAKVYAERLNNVQSDNEELTNRNLELHHKVQSLQEQLRVAKLSNFAFTSSSSDF